MTHETIAIPLNKLFPWDGNVRKTGASDGINELAASIEAHGLLQSLVVREAADGRKRGKYEIIAGRRRYLALKSLVKKRKLAKDYPVACRLADDAVDASELSLAENVVRMPMHPADQFEAFRDLIDGGAGVADVAARFGVSETLVLKRLKLGRVSPMILEAYRRGDVGLELVQAFAINDDHETQERVWNDLPAWNLHPGIVKSALTDGEIPASDKRVKLVGLNAYEAAGGAVRRDLFDPEDGGYALDSELLDNLVAKTLEEAADQVRGEGWKWLEIAPELDYAALSSFERRYPERVALAEEDQAELDRLTAEYDELVDTDDEAEIARLEEIDSRIDELTAAMESWPDDTLALAGAIVSIGWHGDIRVERGLVRPEDCPAQTAETRDDATSDDTAADEPAIKLSAKLTEDLTAQKSAAISAELAKRPDIALAAVVHALALRVFYEFAGGQTCLHISASPAGLSGSLAAPEQCSGLIALEAERERMRDRLPGNPADLWAWCLEQPRDVLLDLLAVIAAHTVDGVQAKGIRPDSPDLRHADAIARAVSLDVGEYFTPGAENFFSRINRPSILAAIDEAKGGHGPGLDKLKKAELAARAEAIVADTGWLPEPLRIADQSETASDDGEGSGDVESDALSEAAE